MTEKSTEFFSYKKSGVDIEQAKTLCGSIKSAYDETNFNNFAGLMEHPILEGYCLAMTTDGIGSKIIPLLERKRYDTIANDLIAMNLNDLICVGASPVGFTDYIATDCIEPEAHSSIINSLARQLCKYNCRLLSGETSEVKRIIRDGNTDIAGCAVGLVKKENMLSKKKVECGNVIVGLKSNGIHSNGLSMILDLHENSFLDDMELETCLAPTTIYVNEILKLVDSKLINAAVNITGGGISDNIKRVIPKSLDYKIDLNKIPQQTIFQKLYKLVGEEVFRVFNMGLGFCVITTKENLSKVMKYLEKYSAFELGEIIKK